MIDFIINLTTLQVILLNLGIIIINLLFVLLIKHLVERKYEKTQSVEETLYFQLKLGKYVQSILIIGSSLIAAFTITPKVDYLGNIPGFLALMAILLGMMIIIYVIQQLVMHSLNTMLRKTTASKGEQVKLLIRVLLFMFIPMVLFFLILMLLDKNVHLSKTLELIIKPLMIGAVYLIFSIIMPFFTKYMIKAVSMEEGEVKEQLKDFLNKAGLQKTRLYLWPTKKNKVANALVSGLVTKDVYMTDYLLENFDMEESKSVLAHEIGHIKRHHLWIRTAMFLGIIVIFPSVGALFDWYEENYSEISIWLGLVILGVLFIAYVGFFMYFIKRVQERQADEYVLLIDVDARVYIKALYKLNKLNNLVMKFGRVDEKLQTHPSTAKRIKWIMEKGGVTEAELEEIKNSII